MEIGEQLLALETAETLADWYVRVLLAEGRAYLVKLTTKPDLYAVVDVTAASNAWDVAAGYVDLTEASWVDVRRALEYTCGIPDLELTSEAGQPTENEIAMLLFAEEPARWTVHTQHADLRLRTAASLIAHAVERLIPTAPPEVCPRCLERTGGVAVPPEGQDFALELTRDVHIGGLVWARNSATVVPPLCTVVRSEHAPHHLVAYYGDAPPPRPCSPICQLPADAIEVWTVDESEEASE